MKQPYNTTIYNTALYLRLSRDDELQGESGSIQTQRMMLRQYAAEHGLTVVDEYIDDGWSGTNFERPSFQRMIDDIEDGKINCVVTKDLSRLGRNYILTGQYTEIYFPSKGVRYIAINDNVDTINGESELAPFLNILNEMHARQTSKKVKAAMHTRFANGAHYGAYAPLGYVKDPDKKGHLLIDPDPVGLKLQHSLGTAHDGLHGRIGFDALEQLHFHAGFLQVLHSTVQEAEALHRAAADTDHCLFAGEGLQRFQSALAMVQITGQSKTSHNTKPPKIVRHTQRCAVVYHYVNYITTQRWLQLTYREKKSFYFERFPQAVGCNKPPALKKAQKTPRSPKTSRCLPLELLSRFELETSSLPRMRSTN